MPQKNNPRIHIFRFGLKGWAALGAALLALGAVIILVLGLFVFFLPILLLAPVLYYFAPRRTIYSVRDAPKDVTIIDGQFRVVDTNRLEDEDKAADAERDQ